MSHPVHLVAATFPEMDAARFAELKADVEANGVLLPVILWRGQIVDGRHRAKACEELGMKCPTKVHECDESALPALVWSLNGQRRDLSPSQRAMIGAKMALLSQHGGDRKSEIKLSKDSLIPGPNRTAREAAEIVGAAPAQISRALRVIRSGDDAVIHAVEQGEMTVGAAHKLVTVKPKDNKLNLASGPMRRYSPSKSINDKRDNAVRMLGQMADILLDDGDIGPPEDGTVFFWQTILDSAIPKLRQFRKSLNQENTNDSRSSA